MNRKRREAVRSARTYLVAAQRVIDTAQEEEADALDSIPENFEGTEMYEKIENASELLGDASAFIDEAIGIIDEVIR